MLPAEKARSWSQPHREAIAAAEPCAMEEAWELGQDIATAIDWLPPEPDARQGALLTLLRRRDDLESLLFCLAAVGEGSGLRRALSRTDEAAVAQTSLWEETLECDDDHLAAVVVAEPDVWWGCLPGSEEG